MCGRLWKVGSSTGAFVFISDVEDLLASVTTEDHVNRDNQQECSEEPPEHVGMNAGPHHRADRSAKEEAQGQESRHAEIHVPGAIIAERSKQSDRR